jgi:hypothetical protein
LSTTHALNATSRRTSARDDTGDFNTPLSHGAAFELEENLKIAASQRFSMKQRDKSRSG